MVLEATMIVVDNSESSRNGDYVPSRWEAQSDAVNLIFSAKTQANPESSVGLMSMGGKGPEVLVTLTTDFGKVLDGIHRTKIRGSTHLATGIQIAGLALKHRQNKSQRQRIIVFTCSPIAESEGQLVKLAKRMKKNNISIDFIVFGDLEPENTKKLEAFNENIKGGDGSHLAIIPPGPSLLSDTLVTTPILSTDGVAPRGGTDEVGADGGGAGFEFGVDPSTDPDLALALRMSMESEMARQEKEGKAKDEGKGESLEGIPEENQPLLDGQGEVSGSGGDKMDEDKKESQEAKEEKEEGDGDGDKMDTA
ncbi:MAG: hypothetical protein L6R41_001404 [Letrouitia leprolyta]|nr:MAG: hypothetical protein L6R41_001404 [Letrouitia leprolyta]